MNIRKKFEKHLEESTHILIKTAVLYLISKAYHPRQYEKDFYDGLLGEKKQQPTSD